MPERQSNKRYTPEFKIKVTYHKEIKPLLNGNASTLKKVKKDST